MQTYTYAALGRRQVSEGTLEVKKPGRMRWDYASPSVKTIVVNGSRLVQWEPEANQAYVDDRFDATAMSAAVTFLLGTGSLEKEFDAAPGDGPGVLVLRPRKADPRVASVTLFTGPDGVISLVVPGLYEQDVVGAPKVTVSNDLGVPGVGGLLLTADTTDTGDDYNDAGYDVDFGRDHRCSGCE